MYDDAHLLLSTGMLPLQNGNTFVELHKQCVPSKESVTKIDPIAYFQNSFEQSSDECSSLRESLKRAAAIGCRKLYKTDRAGFFAALQLIPMRSDRIQLLSSIDDQNVYFALSKKPWSNHHFFRNDKEARVQEVRVDLVSMLISELDSEKRFNESAEILENRGFLLESAERYDRLNDENDPLVASKATGLRVRWVELMLKTSKGKDARDQLLSIVALASIDDKGISLDTRYSSLISQAVIRDHISDLFELVLECKESVMWQYHCLKLLIDSSSNEKLLANLPGKNVCDRLEFIQTIAQDMKSLALALRRKSNVLSPGEKLIISRAEDYFDLAPQRLDPMRLETRAVVNLRVRKVLYSEQCSLPILSGGGGFVQVVDRDKMHFIISRYILSKVAFVLGVVDDLVRVQELQLRPCFENSVSVVQMQEYVDCLQIHFSCVKSMSTLYHSDMNKKELWMKMKKRISDGKQFSAKCLHDSLLSETQLLFTTDMSSSDTANAVILKRQTRHVLKNFVSDRFYKLPMQAKKQDIKHVITQWRLLSLCEDGTFASDELRKEIQRIERHKQTENEYRRKNYDHFINKKKREIFPRLWLWAVESAPEDIINSISIVERMILTSYRGGLTTLTKMDQVSLLEVNVVAIFGALSLRYSEVESPPIFIPKHLYLDKLLAGDSGCFQSDGFGVPLKHALLMYCHNRFDKVFEKSVLHLENAADIVLCNRLLSAPAEDDKSCRFEKALQLSIFILCNAIVFHLAGKDMDTIEYTRDQIALPSLPLQGNVKKLVVELKKIFTHKLYPSHLDNILAKQPNTFLDLANISGSALTSKNDNHVLCKLRQDSKEEVDLRCSEKLDEVSVILASVSFDECSDIFANWDTKSVTFLNEVDMVDPGDDEGEHGKVSEELNATRVIVRFIESQMCKTNEKVNEAILYYRHWKSVIIAFIGRVKMQANEKASLSEQKGDSTLDGESEVEVRSCILEKVVNPFQDPVTFQLQKQNAMIAFNSAIVDATECTYCNWCVNPHVQADRFNQWDISGRRMSFPEFVRNYNRMKFGCENMNMTSDGLFYHTRMPMHNDNAIWYNKRLEEFATVIARIRMGRSLLQQMVSMCDIGEQEDSFNSWYLHTAEEARELHQLHDKAEHDLSNAGVVWSRQPMHTYLWDILPKFYGLPQQAESFFMKKKDKEAHMMQSEGNSNNDEDVESSILNPNAITFTPKFMV